MDPDIDKLIGGMDFDEGPTETSLMRQQLARYCPDDTSIELFLPLFMSLSTQKRAICLFNEDAFVEFLERARLVLLSQGRAPISTPISTTSSTAEASPIATPRAPKASVPASASHHLAASSSLSKRCVISM